MPDDNRPRSSDLHVLAQQVGKLPPCQMQCPNSGDVRGWIGTIAQHEKNGLTLDAAYDEAWTMIARLNPLPASLARICPHPCEDRCIRRDTDGAVSINTIERFLGDWGISRSLPLPTQFISHYRETVGVVGSGPASLSFAYQMASRGYGVTIYERRSAPGGMLRHAIPDYRLPREVLDAEIARLLRLGIAFEANTDIGGTLDLEELRCRHDVIFLGVGAQSARNLGIPGEDGPNVIPGIDYLRDRKAHRPALRQKEVLVIGGGNTAIDAARSARRDGARVTIIYRRSEMEMPAIASEVADARSEGVEFRFLLSPLQIVHDGNRVECAVCQEMRPGEPDADGRCRPQPVEGRVHSIPADAVIVAVSQAPDWHGIEAISGNLKWLPAGESGRLDAHTWAGGDDVGPGIASRAVAHGRAAAESAHAELRGHASPARVTRKQVSKDSIKVDYYREQQREALPRKPETEWLSDPEAEIDQTISYAQAYREARRCMSCGLCFGCQHCFMYCNAGGFTRIEQTRPGNYFVMALETCEGCGKCIDLCPCGFLEAR